MTDLASLRPRVLIANISPGTLSTPFVKGLISAAALGHRIILDDAPPYLDDARNTIVAKAFHIREREEQQVPWDWLLFIDSDMGFTTDHVDTLIAPFLHDDYDPAATPVMCGAYYNTFIEEVPGNDPATYPWVDPVVYDWVKRTYPQDPPGTPERWAYRRYSQSALSTLPPFKAPWNPRAPKSSPTRAVITSVAAAGTGFMCIHHSVLTELAAHHDSPLAWFAEPVVNKVHLGEDMEFCRRVRDLGYPVLVNRACVVPHGKTVWLP